ncbi:1-phosphofructokinase [Fluviispira sanaruensis]|uniref:1-phosphofructokinase n=1 Tax=Fluviispira sanaruensis TaxID=2493639 RepID=A0A4P2VKF1_FLUSA|nr:1-phosphofructokinase [Fluviispira sanaruensis]BBH52374.1 1-phosphofructokinase [Fluviispira sanaruensis]
MKQNIVTVTLNPAIDQTIILNGITLGKVNIAQNVHKSPGGKGINVASCLADWGLSANATGFLGKANINPFEILFQSKHIIDSFIRLEGETRVNIKLSDILKGETTDINLAGLKMTNDHFQELLKYLKNIVNEKSIVVLAGSVPEGLAADSYAQIIKIIKKLGAWVLLDTSGKPLKESLSVKEKYLPNCIKPNQHELSQLAQKTLLTQDDILQFALSLQEKGIENVVVSLGENGSLFINKKYAMHAALPPIKTISSVGAGDALVAGLIAGFHGNLQFEQIAKLAVAFSVAKLGHIGPHLPNINEVKKYVEKVKVTLLK